MPPSDLDAAVRVCVAAANVIQWRRKEVSASILGAATVAWGLFEEVSTMIAMLTFFVWTNASALLNLYCTFFFSLTVLFQTIVSYRTFGLWFSAIVHFSKFFLAHAKQG